MSAGRLQRAAMTRALGLLRAQATAVRRGLHCGQIVSMHSAPTAPRCSAMRCYSVLRSGGSHSVNPTPTPPSLAALVPDPLSNDPASDDIEEPDESRREATHAHDPGRTPEEMEINSGVGMQGLDLAAVAAEAAPAPPPFTEEEIEALVADLKAYLAAQPPGLDDASPPDPRVAPAIPAAPASSAAASPSRPFLVSWSVKEVCSWYLQVEEQLRPVDASPSGDLNAPLASSSAAPSFLSLLVKHRIDGARLLAFTTHVDLIPWVPPALLSRILYLKGLDSHSQLFHSDPAAGEHDDPARHSDPNMRHLQSILHSTVKIFCTSTAPDFARPWQQLDQVDSSSSGFVISGRRILCNAHGATHASSLRVRRHGDATKYKATVRVISHEADLAILDVADERFWEGMKPLKFGQVPRLQEQVIVVGFPTGGDSICVTKGVVSRILVSNYVHSDEALLTVQIDAAINSGNSGGPVLLNGLVVGVAFQGVSNLQSVGYIIPTPVVQHFLTDLQLHQGRYTGFPSFHGLTFQKLENESLKKFLGLGVRASAETATATTEGGGNGSTSSSSTTSVTDEAAPAAPNGALVPAPSAAAAPAPLETGIVLMDRAPLDDPESILRPGDVLTHLDGLPVADDGSIFFRHGERISARYIPSSKFVGDYIRIRLVRDKKPMTVNFKLRAKRSLVPTHLYDQQPSYFILAGLVFTPLSRPYLLDTFGRSWAKRAPVDLLQKTYYGALEFEGQQAVLLSTILVDDSNAGYGASFHNIELSKINGERVKHMRHLVELVERERKAGAPFLRFDFTLSRTIVLETAEAFEANSRILRHNNIEHDRSVGLRGELTEAGTEASDTGKPEDAPPTPIPSAL